MRLNRAAPVEVELESLVPVEVQLERLVRKFGLFEAALGELLDGKWRWKQDLIAAAVVATSVGGLITGSVALLMSIGVVGAG